MVKIKLTTKNLIFTMVHVHQAKSMWLRHWWLVQLPDIAVFNTPPILAAVQKGAQL